MRATSRRRRRDEPGGGAGDGLHLEQHLAAAMRAEVVVVVTGDDPDMDRAAARKVAVEVCARPRAQLAEGPSTAPDDS